MPIQSSFRTSFAVLLAAGALSLPALAQEGKPMSPTSPPSDTKTETKAEPQEVVTSSGLKYVDLKVGDGDEAKSGYAVEVHYTGWLTNGTKFDSSLDRKQPFKFKLGAGQVIDGWDQGVAGMKVGGKRKLTIPPGLGYGARGAGGVIPPNSTLVFEVELLGVHPR
jgi:FKBP-type peptidyl-prolyl cis-trans isomerase FkpA